MLEVEFFNIRSDQNIENSSKNTFYAECMQMVWNK